MSVLSFYKDRLEPVRINDGIAEDVLILRRGKTENAKTISDAKILLAPLQTTIKNGDILHRGNGNSFLVASKQSPNDADGCTQIQGMRINGYVDIIEFRDVYEDYERVGEELVTLAKDCPVYFKDVSAQMKMYDAGLLTKTVKKIIVQSSVPMKLLYRISMNGKDYQVDNIDTAKYMNLLEVQVSEDTR